MDHRHVRISAWQGGGGGAPGQHQQGNRHRRAGTCATHASGRRAQLRGTVSRAAQLRVRARNRVAGTASTSEPNPTIEAPPAPTCEEPIRPCLCIASLANSALLRHSYLWARGAGGHMVEHGGAWGTGRTCDSARTRPARSTTGTTTTITLVTGGSSRAVVPRGTSHGRTTPCALAPHTHLTKAMVFLCAMYRLLMGPHTAKLFCSSSRMRGRS